MKIESLPPTSIECKRLYLPFKIILTCPKCGQDTEIDLSRQHYLSYPEVGVPMDYDCYCIYCDHEWTEKIQLTIGLSVVADSIEIVREKLKPFTNSLAQLHGEHRWEGDTLFINGGGLIPKNIVTTMAARMRREINKLGLEFKVEIEESTK
jgi:hypothetical protein